MYETRSTVEQTNIRNCYNYAYKQYLAYKAFDDHLFNEVYPSLVRAGVLPSVCCLMALALSCGLA